jgi:hypothetical protein
MSHLPAQYASIAGLVFDRDAAAAVANGTLCLFNQQVSSASLLCAPGVSPCLKLLQSQNSQENSAPANQHHAAQESLPP